MPLSLGRAVLLVVICSLISTGLTVASTRNAPSIPVPARAEAIEPAKLTVPDVRGEAYVFAKSDLETSGFAWRLKGGAPGYAAMVVVSQSPAPGAVVLDTGYPTLTLRLAKPKGYVPAGQPQQASPYPGSVVRLAADAATSSDSGGAAGAGAESVAATAASPRATKPRKPATGPAARRPVAFHVRGAKAEPLDEMPLPDRARMLAGWLGSHPKPTAANQRHWLYQHAWIVTGARFGWWRGDEALRILIGVDRRVEARWGIGARSEAEARRALAFVEARLR
jgi:hypothetical protein